MGYNALDVILGNGIIRCCWIDERMNKEIMSNMEDSCLDDLSHLLLQKWQVFY